MLRARPTRQFGPVLKVAVLGGGPSVEAEVSRVSAQQVIEAIQDQHDVRYFEFDIEFPNLIIAHQPDVVFPALHGTPGEDGSVQGFLDVIQLPYVGSDVSASARAIDKFLAKAVFRSAGLSVLDCLRIQKDQERDAVDRIKKTFGECVVVKPIGQGSALGVTPLPHGGDVATAVHTAFEYGDSILVEPFVAGREITVGVLDEYGSDPTALPVTEIVVAQDEWYDYYNRYTPGQSEHIVNPPDLTHELTNALKDEAVSAHVALGCDDLSRADFLLDESGKFWLLEVNTMPGMTPSSLYPDAARHVDIPMPDLIERLIQSAIRRHSDTSVVAS